MKIEGVELAVNYNYTGVDDSCKKTNKQRIKIKDYIQIVPDDEYELAKVFYVVFLYLFN